MKLIATILLGGAILAVQPVYAQDMNHMDNMKQTKAQHPVVHRTVHHRVTYRRNYKTDSEEHQQTEDLNRQYRGVSGSEAH